MSKTKSAALSQIEYLEKKMQEIEEKIQTQYEIADGCNNMLNELFFQKGKLYSEIELMKRVRPYE